MNVSKFVAAGVLALFAGVGLHAQTSDSTIHVNTGGGGSPPLLTSGTITLATDGSGDATTDLLAGGLVEEFSVTTALSQTIPPNHCAMSNAFFTLIPGVGTTTGSGPTGTFTCTYYTVFTSPVPITGDGSTTETLAQKQADCLAKGVADNDDCLGVAAGNDLIVSLGGFAADSTVTLSYSATIPEPGSFSLLLIGLAGLPFVRRKLSA